MHGLRSGSDQLWLRNPTAPFRSDLTGLDPAGGLWPGALGQCRAGFALKEWSRHLETLAYGLAA